MHLSKLYLRGKLELCVQRFLVLYQFVGYGQYVQHVG